MNRNIIVIATTTTLYNFAWWVIISWTPSFLMSSRGLEVATAGMMTGIFVLPRVIGSPLWGVVSDKVGRMIPLSFTGITGFIIGIVYYLFDLSFAGLIVLTVVYGFMTSAGWSLQMALTQDCVDPRYVGTATGFVQNMASVGATLAPFIAGIVLTSIGISQAMVLCASIPLLIAGLIILLCRERREDRA